MPNEPNVMPLAGFTEITSPRVLAGLYRAIHVRGPEGLAGEAPDLLDLANSAPMLAAYRAIGRLEIAPPPGATSSPGTRTSPPALDATAQAAVSAEAEALRQADASALQSVTTALSVLCDRHFARIDFTNTPDEFVSRASAFMTDLQLIGVYRSGQHSDMGLRAEAGAEQAVGRVICRTAYCPTAVRGEIERLLREKCPVSVAMQFCDTPDGFAVNLLYIAVPSNRGAPPLQNPDVRNAVGALCRGWMYYDA